MGLLTRLRVPLEFILNHPLTRRNRTAALARFVRWQVAWRFIDSPVLVPWVGASKLFVTNGMNGATGNVYVGLHEFEEMAFALHVLRPGDVFVDVGANIGAYTVLASAVAGANTIAIEPDKRSAEWLSRNVAANLIGDRVDVHTLAVADKAGTLHLTDDGDTVNHIVGREGSMDHVSAVRADTLDNLARDRHPAVIKVDVEGYEFEVFCGAPATLADPSLLAVIVETNGSGAAYGHSDAAVLAILEAAGFRRAHYDPWTRHLTSCGDEPLSGNSLMVRNLSVLEQRLRSAEKIHVLNTEI